MIKLRQQDIQKLGGKAARYPSSYIIHFLLSSVLGTVNLRILDVTYGEGRFYIYFGSKIKWLVGNDIRKLRWLVYPNRFYLGSSWKLLDKLLTDDEIDFDIVVVDPPFTPYSRGLEKRYWYMPSRGHGTPDRIILDAINIASSLSVPYVLIHHRLLKAYNKKVVKAIEFYSLFRYSHPSRSYYYILRV